MSSTTSSNKTVTLSRKSTLVRTPSLSMPTSKPTPLPSNIFTDEDGRIPLIIGFGTTHQAATWGTPDARYDLGHEVFRTDPATTYEKLFAFVSDLLRTRELKELIRANGHVNGNGSGSGSGSTKKGQTHVLKELTVAWGSGYGRDLSRTVITEANITSVLLLMARRGVDVIGGVCVPVGKERAHKA